MFNRAEVQKKHGEKCKINLVKKAEHRLEIKDWLWDYVVCHSNCNVKNRQRANWNLVSVFVLSTALYSDILTSQPPPSSASHSGHCSPALITPEPCTRQLEKPRHPIVYWNYWNYPHLSLPSLHVLPLLSLPLKTKIRTFVHFSLVPFVPWPTLMYPPYNLCSVVCLFLLGTMSTKISSQWQLSPDMLVSPYLNNTKTYILKQY